MELALTLLVIGLIVLGVLGCLVPYIPGTPFILVAALIHGLATGFDPIGPWRLGILCVLALVAQGLDFVAGVLGTKRMGGTAWGVAGAALGVLVGIFFGPPGLLLGPVLGAVAGEALRSGALDRTSLRSGVGAFLGLVAGVVAKVGIALTMSGLLLWWIWRG